MARHSLVLAILLGAGAIDTVFSESPAVAFTAIAPVTIDGVRYVVSVQEISCDSLSSVFATLENGGKMPWYDDPILANKFKKVVSGSLGLPNVWPPDPVYPPDPVIPSEPFYPPGLIVPRGLISPCFAVELRNIISPSSLSQGLNSLAVFPLDLDLAGLDPVGVNLIVPSQDTVYYATAVRIPTPAPGPLPLLGVGAAFGYSRMLRRRIKSNKLPVASTIA
jgi:hypothetical protein